MGLLKRMMNVIENYDESHSSVVEEDIKIIHSEPNEETGGTHEWVMNMQDNTITIQTGINLRFELSKYEYKIENENLFLRTISLRDFKIGVYEGPGIVNRVVPESDIRSQVAEYWEKIDKSGAIFLSPEYAEEQILELKQRASWQRWDHPEAFSRILLNASNLISLIEAKFLIQKRIELLKQTIQDFYKLIKESYPNEIDIMEIEDGFTWKFKGKKDLPYKEVSRLFKEYGEEFKKSVPEYDRLSTIKIDISLLEKSL